MVDRVLPYVAPLKSLVLRIGWDNGRIVPNLKSPVLYLAGDSDELVPHFHMLELHKTSSKCSVFTGIHIVRGGSHNDSWYQGGVDYWKAISTFMTKAVASFKETNRIAVLEKEETNHWRSQTSLAVAMGSEAEKKTSEVTIPIMPNNLIGMAREATAATLSLEKDKKKKRKTDESITFLTCLALVKICFYYLMQLLQLTYSLQ